MTYDEFEDLTGVDPESAEALTVKLPYRGPMSPEGTYYLLGLEGMPVDVALGVRKIKLKMVNGTMRVDTYLRPEEQLLQSQGQRMLGHVHSLVAQNVENVEPGMSAKVKTVADLRRQASIAAAARQAEDEALSRAEQLQSGLGDMDSGDELMEKDAAPKGRASNKRRAAGFAGGMFKEAQEPLPATRPKAARLNHQSARSAAKESLPAEVAPASSTPSGPALCNPTLARLKGSGAQSETARSDGGKKEELDPEMQTVAENTTGSIRCLMGLTCENFLQISMDSLLQLV